MTVERLAELVERRLGLRADDKRDTLAGVLARHRDGARYLARVEAGDPAAVGELAAELVVGETYFYRHEEQLRAFAEVVVPPVVAARGRVAVLSAGCATGEEPYTLAMILRERAPAAAHAIHAIDANPEALARARRGTYAPWTLRAVPPDAKRRWFAQDGNRWSLAREIREAVTFHERSVLDAADWPAGPWDAIFCRNVTMYFTEARAQEALRLLSRALVPGGYLFLGHAETLRGRSDELAVCHSHGTFYYRRTTAAGETAPWYAQIAASAARVDHLRVVAEVPDVPRDLATARRLIGEERYAEALRELGDDATDAETLALRAIALAHGGPRETARDACLRLLLVTPGEPAPHYLLALVDESIGDLAAARLHARRAAELDPTFAMARLHLGLIARRLGEPSVARDELRRAVELLERESAERLALFGGGFGRPALVELCRAELARVTP